MKALLILFLSLSIHVRFQYAERVLAHFEKYHVRGIWSARLALTADPLYEAYITEHGDHYIVHVDVVWLSSATSEEIFETIAHELCHAHHDGLVMDQWKNFPIHEIAARHTTVYDCASKMVKQHQHQHGRRIS